MRIHQLLSAVVVGGLLAAAAGCGTGNAYEKFIPKPGTARSALEAALIAWQNGQGAAPVTVGATPVQVLDSKRRPGQRLTRFEIVKEEAGDGPRWFSVKLTLEKPAGEQVARYVVIGNSPLWVYREEDYKKASGI
jgi:hypothetical protein